MAIRILPFRQYSDHEVVNLYALTDADVLETTTLADSAGGDAGVFVKVSDGDFNNDPITYQTNTYLGDNSFPFLGGTAMYPQVNLKVTPATSGAGCLGMTLLQTAKNDENGEKLLYNPRKAEEMQVVLSGQAMPVATKGIFLYSGALTSTTNGLASSVTPGVAIYQTNSGNPGELGLSSTGPGGTAPVKVGKALGKVDANRHVLIKLEL